MCIRDRHNNVEGIKGDLVKIAKSVAYLWQSERLNTLQQTLEKLANPSLMYKRPTGEDYETVAQTLDYLHNNVEGIKGDLVKIAKLSSY